MAWHTPCSCQRCAMRANVFRGVNHFGIEEVERPRAGVGEAVIRVTLTTICGTDLHIVRGEYPGAARPRHRPRARRRRSRSSAPASPATRSATACWSAPSRRAASAARASRGTSRSAATASGYEALGGWRLGNTINGAQAEYVLDSERAGQPGEDPGRAHATSRSSCLPTSRRPASAAPSRAASGSATRSSCSPRVRSACARPRAPS